MNGMVCDFNLGLAPMVPQCVLLDELVILYLVLI